MSVRFRAVRGASLGSVLLLLALARIAYPDTHARAEALCLLILPLGYGHLLGALLSTRAPDSKRATPRLRPSRPLLSASILAAGFGLYAALLSAHPMLALVPLLAISSWHIVENDLSAGRSLSLAPRLGPMPRDVDSHLSAFGLTSLLLLAAVSSESSDPARSFAAAVDSPWEVETAAVALRALAATAGAALALRARSSARRAGGIALSGAALLLSTPDLSLSEVVAASTLYHVVSWILIGAHRIRSIGDRGSARRRALALRLAAVHLAPIAPVLVASIGSARWLELVRSVLADPGIYLFWAGVHVLHTARLRRLAAKSR